MNLKPSLFFLIVLVLIPVIFSIRVAAEQTNTSKPVIKQLKPEPTLVLDNETSIYVLFKFGAWVRVAYNNSKVVAPVAVYVYSREFPVTVKSNYNQTWQGLWGLALNLTKLDLNKPLILHVKYKNKEYTLRFMAVKSIEEKEKKEEGLVFPWSKVKEWLDREAQAAAFIALIAIISAFGLKRKLLLLRTFNGVNLLILFTASLLITILAPRFNHSEWLALPFLLSYITTYRVTPAGRKVYLIKIIPSMRKIIWETAVLYRTAEGLLAYAKQSVSEAFKRLLGKHIVLKDAEINKLGEVSSDKFWTIEDVEFYEKSEGLLVLDAQLTKERVVEESKRGEGLYE